MSQVVDAAAGSQRLIELFESGLTKKAQDILTDYVRVRNRERGFLPQIIPPIQVTNADLDRQVDTDKPVMIVEYEPESPPATSVPFVSTPLTRYIKGKRFRVMFQRILTPKFTKDVDELRTYKNIDIRQVLSDNSLKDMQKEIDGKFIATTEFLLGGVAGATNPDTGIIQWKAIAGGITRDTFIDALNIMPETTATFTPSTVLMNLITVREFEKWGRDEAGGDTSEQIALKGWGEKNWFGTRILVTIKKDLVPNNRMYFFAQPDVVGKHAVLTDTTMYVKTEGFMIEFFAYINCGATIANSSALAIADFTP